MSFSTYLTATHKDDIESALDALDVPTTVTTDAGKALFDSAKGAAKSLVEVVNGDAEFFTVSISGHVYDAANPSYPYNSISVSVAETAEPQPVEAPVVQAEAVGETEAGSTDGTGVTGEGGTAES